MRHRFGSGLLIGALVVGALFAPSVFAGQAPTVYAVSEARDSAGTGPVIVLTGRGLSKFRTFALLPLGEGSSSLTLSVLRQSSSSLFLAVGGDPAPGNYLLGAADRAGQEQVFTVLLSNGKAVPGAVESGALSVSLRADLDDAETLGGNGPSFYSDAGNLSAGTLDPARYSAYADLTADGKIGVGAGQVSAGDHNHDDRYAPIGEPGGEFLTKEDADAAYAAIDHDHESEYATKLLIGAKVHLSTDTDQPSTLNTGLPFDQEAFDTDSCHDPNTNPSRLTCNTAGYYLVIGRARYAQAGSTVQMNLLKNGTVLAEHFSIQDTHALGVTVEISTVVELQVSDYLEFSPGSGVDGNKLKSGVAKTELMMVRLGQ